MCRWVVYMGHPVLLSEVITKPKHSLISLATNRYLPSLFNSCEKISIKTVVQEYKANHLINGDGFGIGWYIFEFSPEPCVFSSVTPPWNNRNLNRICDHVKSPVFFGHVRAATTGSVTEINCHPFQIGRFMFMHNGGIPDFYKFKAKFLFAVKDKILCNIRGTTDTEHIFGYFLNNIPNFSEQQSLEIIIWSLLRTIRFIMDTTGKVCSLNFAVTDGVYMIATRFKNGYGEKAPALYYSVGSQFRTCERGHFVRDPTNNGVIDSVVVSSEPITYDKDHWQKVPSNCMLVTGPSTDGKGKKFVNAPIFIGGVVDRCFQKWKKIALSGKPFKPYVEDKDKCSNYDDEFKERLQLAFNWAKDSPIAC